MSEFSSRSLGLRDEGVQVGIEEQQVVIFSSVLLRQALLVIFLQEIVNGFNGCQVSVR